LERSLIGDVVVDKLNSAQEPASIGAGQKPQRERMSKIDLKGELSMMNQLNKMVYGSGAAKVDDKITLDEKLKEKIKRT
jgi:hypothetical protein